MTLSYSLDEVNRWYDYSIGIPFSGNLDIAIPNNILTIIYYGILLFFPMLYCYDYFHDNFPSQSLNNLTLPEASHSSATERPMEILDEVIFPYQGGRQAQAAVRLDGGGHRSSRLNSEKIGISWVFYWFLW